MFNIYGIQLFINLKSFNEFFSDCRIGARHDGNPKGAADCPPFDGFIMSSGLMLHENGFEWSSCSINAFYNFIKYEYIEWFIHSFIEINVHKKYTDIDLKIYCSEDRAKCLYNEPDVLGKQIPRTLPGKLMSLDEQCKRVFGTSACNVSLVNIKCFNM